MAAAQGARCANLPVRSIAMMVRKARCEACGAAKVTPSESLYIYCDFCGTLMDLDVGRLRTEGVTPGPDYAALQERLAPALEAARARRDRPALMALHRQLQTLFVRDCAAGYPPRIKDQAYRAQLIEYLAYGEVVRELDPRIAAAAEALSAASAGLEFDERGGRYVIRAVTLWPILLAQRRAAQVYRACLLDTPDPVLDPDGAPDGVGLAIAIAMVIRGFLTMVDDATAVEMLARTGLAAGYEQGPDVELHAVFCTGCGARRTLPSGARRALCEACGRLTEVGTAAHCGQCNAAIVFGLHQAVVRCGHCHAEARLAPRLT